MAVIHLLTVLLAVTETNVIEMEKEMTTRIKDIYAGKPDAKDAVESIGLKSFIDTFVMPENFNLEALVSGSCYFITGYKGTGKTALLYYIDNMIKKMDAQTCSSFIFFKGDYSDLKKQEMENIAKRLISAISIGNDVILEGTDFEYIWRWLLYSRIIEDNTAFNYGLFKNNEKWRQFEEKLSQITSGRKKRFLTIPPIIKLACPIKDGTNLSSVTPSIELKLNDANIQETKEYALFVKLIDEADNLFLELERSDIPYYIFIDELEAYNGDSVVFKRDLRLIRDLIFSVKKINQVMASYGEITTKIICSVRTEIINAINRFIISKEINKITSGYEVPLKWNYTNTNSFSHPIMKILTKRIEYAERKNNEFVDEKTLIEKWFPETLNNADASNYILNNSWCKPRDMVRLILAAQNCLASSECCFSQKVIDQCRKDYSRESLTEIKEEMRALYSAEDIDLIFTCFTGYKRVFSIAELKDRIKRNYNNSVLSNNLQMVLTDLYRLGVIGNYFSGAGSYRWQHKGEDGIIIDDDWKIAIHYGLLNTLSVNSKQDRARPQNADKVVLKAGDIVCFIMMKNVLSGALGFFEIGDEKIKAFVHISQISKNYIDNIEDYLKIGKGYNARVLGYDEKHDCWQLSVRGLL